MDSVWIERLTDEKPGLSFLSEYCRALRLLSGLSGLGCIRARRQALSTQLDSRFRNYVLSEPRVREFLNFVGEFSAQELPMVFEVIRQHLFPDSPAKCLFRAASLDPRVHPVESLRAAVTDLRELELSLGTLPTGDWPRTPVQADNRVEVESILEVSLALPRPICPLLPSSLAGVFGPASFGAPLCDPEVERLSTQRPEKLTVYVTFRGDYVVTKMAELRDQSTGAELLEAIWPFVKTMAKDSGDPFHYAALYLPGRRMRMWLQDPLVNFLHNTEAVLEAAFSDVVHTNSVAFHTELGAVPMVTRNQTGDDPQVPLQFKHVRPKTPERKRKSESKAQTQGEKPKRVRRSKWDEPTEPASSSKASGPKFALAFNPPPGLNRIPTQLIRLLNSIQSQFPAALDTLNFIVLNGGEDPMFFGNVTDFGTVLSTFSRDSKLSLLSYGTHWSLALEDVEVGGKTASVFLKVMRGSSGHDETHKQMPKNEDGDDHDKRRDKGRSRSPTEHSTPAPKPSRPVFQPTSGSSAFQRGSESLCAFLSGVQAGCNLGSCQGEQVEPDDHDDGTLGAVHWPLLSSSGVHTDDQNPKNARSGAPFDRGCVSSQVSLGGCVLPDDIRHDEDTGVGQDVAQVCSTEPLASCSSGLCGCPDPSSLSFCSDSGCCAEKHSGRTLPPWLRGAPPVVAGDTAADDSAFGLEQGGFVCQKRVQQGQTQIWKNCLDFRVEREDIVHGFGCNDNFGFVVPEGAGGEICHHCEGPQIRNPIVAEVRDVEGCNRKDPDTQNMDDWHTLHADPSEVPLAQLMPSDTADIAARVREIEGCVTTAPDTQTTVEVPLAQVTPSDPGDIAASIHVTQIDEGSVLDISPTCVWTQPCVEEEPDDGPPYRLPKTILLPGQDGLRVPAFLGALRDSQFADLGSDAGITLVYRSYEARFQLHMQAPAHQLVTARAYMVQGDCCPSCFLFGRGWTCSRCSSPMSQFRLPTPPEITFGNCVDECFHRYVSHSLQALQFTGPMTIHFRVIAAHDSGVIEAVTTEGRRIWVILHSWYDTVVSLRVGDDLSLFQGFCCGPVTGVPVFHAPPPSWNGILVKRSTGDTPPRVPSLLC